jgi:hypothetical protein
MLYFELPELSINKAYQASLGLLEAICDEHALENHFGTVSTATSEFINVIKRTTKGEDVQISVGFILENDMLYAHFEINGTIIALPTLFEEGKEFTPIKTIAMLSDEISFTQNKKGVSFGFHVKQEVQERKIETSIKEMKKTNQSK